MKEETLYRVVVMGGDHYNTYGIVRSLGEVGVHSFVVVLGKKNCKSFVLKSKYIDRGFGCETPKDAIETLLNNFDSTTKNIVICCSDEAEELVLKHYEELSSSLILPVCKDYENTALYMNKDAISLKAEECGIRIPKTWTIRDRKTEGEIIFPCITKPLYSTLGHKSDIVVCHTPQELNAVIQDKERCADYVVQEYVEFEKEISILGAVLNDGSVCFSGCIDKIRTCSIGTSSFAKMIDNSILGDTKDKLELLLQKTQYRGLFSAEFLMKGDEFYFLEVNFRNDGNTYVATASGNNLPYRYVASYLDIVPQIKPDATYPCYFMLDIEDFMARNKNNITYKQWRKDLKMANCYLVYNKSDKKPFYKKVQNLFEFYLRAVLRKIGLTK